MDGSKGGAFSTLWNDTFMEANMQKIRIAALGWTQEALTLGAMRALKSAHRVLLRTGKIGAADWLRAEGVPFETLDALYDACDDFDELNRRIVAAVEAAGDVVYGVPDVRDETVGLLLRACGAELLPGVPTEGALLAHAQGAAMCLAAADWEDFQPSAHVDCLVREIDSRPLASEVKLRLMEAYPAQAPVLFAAPGGAVAAIKLSQLDRMQEYGPRACAYVSRVEDIQRLERYDFAHVEEIVRRLRAPDGCPWDREQTHESMRANMLEEAYEVVDAIESGDMDALYDELGDVLMQVALHAQIAREHGEFDMSDVTTAICRKLLFRHPHVFGDASADSSDDVLALWEVQKKKEKPRDTLSEAMRGITRALPAAKRAAKVQKKAASVHFDWDSAQEALGKVAEEAAEVQEALAQGSGVEEEIGDLLFSVVNVARLAKVDPELALSGATKKFIDRFAGMEAAILRDGRRMEDMTLAEMDRYWEQEKNGM